MAKEEIKNKNLFLAEKLLEISKDKPYLATNNSITLTRDDVFEISREEVIVALKRLEHRGVISFADEEDKYNENRRDYIVLDLDKSKLSEFIETAKDRLYKMTDAHKKKEELSRIIEVLDFILNFEPLGQPVEITKIKEEYKDIFWWLADYSGMLKIIYENVPDPNAKKLLNSNIQYVVEAPTKFIITDIKGIKRLEREVRQLVIMPQEERIKLFLNNNGAVDWRCADCNDWLGIKLEDEKQIADYLNDFLIKKFKICKGCRKRNYFSINKKGIIKFSITRKRLLKELEKQKEELMLKKLNSQINKIKKSNLHPNTYPQS